MSANNKNIWDYLGIGLAAFVGYHLFGYLKKKMTYETYNKYKLYIICIIVLMGLVSLYIIIDDNFIHVQK